MLSGMIKFCPPVRRGNDLQEQVDVPAGQVHTQAKRAGNAQSSDEAINSVWKRGVNWTQTQNLNKTHQKVRWIENTLKPYKVPSGVLGKSDKLTTKYLKKYIM